MPLETANYIYDLVQSNPPDTDLVQQGDDHLRLLKKVIQQTWPNITGPNLPTSTGSANAHIVTHVYGPAAYSAGQMVTFKAGFTNTGPTTINVNGAGVTTIGKAGAALVAGDLIAGSIYTAIYDAANTAFMLIAGSGAFLPLTGGTLTGALTISQAGNLTISPASGNSAGIFLNKPSGGSSIQDVIYGQTAGSTRWIVLPGDGTAEGGTNTGSNFTIYPADDTGATLNTPFTITRASGAVTINSSSNNNLTLRASSTGYVTQLFQKNVSGAASNIISQTAGTNRWVIWNSYADAESGSNVGSSFFINRFSDGGSDLGSAIAINRATGTCTFQVAIVNGPSDRTLKQDIEPLQGSLEKVLALQGVSFAFKATPEKREIGLIAQDVEPILPELIQTYQTGPSEGKGPETKLGLDYPKLTALLIEAVKTLTARVETLETKLADLGA